MGPVLTLRRIMTAHSILPWLTSCFHRGLCKAKQLCARYQACSFTHYINAIPGRNPVRSRECGSGGGPPREESKGFTCDNCSSLWRPPLETPTLTAYLSAVIDTAIQGNALFTSSLDAKGTKCLRWLTEVQLRLCSYSHHVKVTEDNIP